MSLESKEIARFQKCLIKGAEDYLSATPNIAAAIQQIRKGPGLLNLRVREFVTVCHALNEELTTDSGFGEGYLNTIVFWHELNKSIFPTPSHLFRPRNKPLLQIANQTFMEIRDKIHTGEWQFPNQISDPNILATGLLIEGYGLFLAKLYDTPELSRIFVLSIEEALWNKFQGSSLLKDALPWMIEERNAFSWNMEKGLEKLTSSLPEEF